MGIRQTTGTTRRFGALIAGFAISVVGAPLAFAQGLPPASHRQGTVRTYARSNPPRQSSSPTTGRSTAKSQTQTS